jgi:hypothetical protein
MRITCFVFVLALAANSFAQESSKPNGKFYGPLATGDWKMKPKPTGRGSANTLPQTFALGAPPVNLAATCSVPLLEVPAPTDVHFTMKRMSPPEAEMAPMPHADIPAPPCAH